MSGGWRRLEHGRQVDRGTVLTFEFDGKVLTGLRGDSIASALLANGVRTVSRSFKYRRPRGVFSAGIEEPNALAEVRDDDGVVPSVRLTTTTLQPGMRVRSHSGWPHVQCDVLRIFDFIRPLLAAGFYNKTFIWPSWGFHEPFIRRLSGLGQAPTSPDASRYETRNLTCDVLVVGAGVSGLQAALDAVETGLRVVIVDQDTAIGGRGAWDGSVVAGKPAEQWIVQARNRLEAAPDVRILLRTTALGKHDADVVSLVEHVDGRDRRPRERYWVVRARKTVLATGAIEQSLIFEDNDRPGVMLAGAARQYLRRYSLVPRGRVIVATNNDSAYDTVRDLDAAQASVVAVVDSRPEVDSSLQAELRELGIPLLLGAMPARTHGFSLLKSVTVGRLSGGDLRETSRIAADMLLVSGGWNPTLHLFAQHGGGKLAYDPRTRTLEPASGGGSVSVLSRSSTLNASTGPRCAPGGKTSRQWVDLRHDVTVADLELAVRENYRAIEHVKRYTTVGMSVEQGKTSNLAALEIVAKLRDVAPQELGHTTFRPPFTPVSLGAIAARECGEFVSPVRRSPIDSFHVENGGLLEDYGDWKRPAAYPRGGESRHQAMVREARTTRIGLGLFDASTLGKIEVRGPDALEFLDRFYINNLRTLKPGRARYGFMLRESGVILDDSTVTLLAPDHLLITTTSANGLLVGAWLEDWLQCEWPELRVCITPVTDQWANVAMSGIDAQKVLAKLSPGIDVSTAAFPQMGMREARLFGKPARIHRVSYSGELTYEINVPADLGRRLWDALLEEGAAPYGVEALLLMRMEKGFLNLGTDTDGTTIPDDIGWGKVAASKATHYIGKRSLSLPEHTRPDRFQLVGLAGIADADLPIGSHLRLADSTHATDGWVTSSGRTVLKGQPIALAMLRAGRQHHDEVVTVHNDGRIAARAKVVRPVFYDEAGECMNA